jgi:xanthine dehydrogenase accessory factor
MKEFLQTIWQWNAENKKIVLARVIQTWGSSPRPVGSCLFISSDGEMAGSVSGGCVEGAVLKEAREVFEKDEGKRLFYGVTDDEAWAVGLSCGGKIQVYIEPFNLSNPLSKQLADRLAVNEGSVWITRLADGTTSSALLAGEEVSGEAFAHEVIGEAKEAYRQRTHKHVKVGEMEYFVQVFPPRSKIIIIGAAHITADLIQLAHHFDFETIVIDPRSTFANNTTFPVKPDKIYEAYPSEVLTEIKVDPYTYAVILSHDPKIDDDALKVLLRSEAAYIGALGSRKNHEKRINRLLNAGFTPSEIDKVNAPIGVDIRALGAKEIALSIMAAIVKAKNQFTF